MGREKGYECAKRMRGIGKGGQLAKADGFDRSSPDTLASQIDEWFLRLEERNYSLSTVEIHKWSLRTFLTWAQERELRKSKDIDKPILESYQRWLYRYKKENGEALSVRTQRSRLGALQRFFAYLCKHNYLNANPASDLELPRKPYKQLPKSLNLDEVIKLMSIPDTSDVLGIRDRTILEVFYATGIRRSELSNLDVDDADLSSGVLIIREGKGGKSRVVPLGEHAEMWIGKYLESSREKLLVHTRERALFISGYGERFNPNYIGNWVRRMIDKAELSKTGSCHLLRHSCATHMLENGADIRFIQQILGHSRLDTTQIYTEVKIDTLKAVHARTHPHGKIGY